MKLLAWALLLVCQNASFTLVSRARNSRSLWYHGVASVFSNGIWFASQFILISIVIKELRSIPEMLTTAAVYITSSVTGSVLMHYISMKFLEKGKRAVG